jgi:uncharacterized membrane protein
VSHIRRLWRRANKRLERARLEYVFLVLSLVGGTFQVFIVPPLQVPDEGDHWFRAWAMTNGQLTTDPAGAVTLPGSFARLADLYTGLISNTQVLPPSLNGQPGFTGYDDLFNDTASSDTIEVGSRAANYGPVGYLPQAVGVGLGRLMGASPLACFYLARFANLFAAVLLFFFAIRLAPFGKQLVMLLALLPMTMFQLASVSPDAITISGAILFTSLLLWASTRPTLRGLDIALVIAAAAVFLNIKPGYGALALLVLLLRPSQLGGRGGRLALLLAATVFVVVGVTLLNYLMTGAAGRAEADVGSGGQLILVAREPFEFLALLWSNLQNHLLKWTLESVGILGWLTVALPAALYLFVLIVGIAFFFGRQEEVGLQTRQRMLLAAVAVATFVSLAVVLFVYLPIVNGELGFQGRYLAPVWLLILLSAYGIRFAKWRLDALAMIGMLLVIMVVNLQTLVTTYGA